MLSMTLSRSPPPAPTTVGTAAVRERDRSSRRALALGRAPGRSHSSPASIGLALCRSAQRPSVRQRLTFL